MVKSFDALKEIELTIRLGSDTFSGGGNTKVIAGLATECTITKPGLPEKNGANIQVYGLSLDDMAQLTMLAYRPLFYRHNTISIRAGASGSLHHVYSGDIMNASADFNAGPDVVMSFEASTGGYAQLLAAPVTTVHSQTSAEDLLRQFAADAGFNFSPVGELPPVSKGWYPGSPIEKAVKLVSDLGGEIFFDDDAMVTAPRGMPRSSLTAVVTPDTGLIGSPTFNQNGISVTTFFNPQVQYGGMIDVDTIVPKARGLWRVTKVVHSLSAVVGGPWQTQIEAAYPYYYGI